MRNVEMEFSPLPGDPTAAVAAEWIVRLQNDELSMEEIAQWQRWLGASEEHRKAFERLEEVWTQLEALPNKLEPPALPQVRRYGSRYLAAAASIGVLAVGVAFVSWQAGRGDAPSSSVSRFVAETATGEHRDMSLPDGSQVSLGGRSVARVHFMAGEREISLDSGEAFFSVAKDARRPFVVRAGKTRITAIGTAFNVRRNGDRIHVAVTDGAVRISAPGVENSASPVTAGQQFTVDPSIGQSTLRMASPISATVWRSGRLEYLGEPLKYVVDDLNRYAARQIIIRDPAVGEMRLTGTVFENDVDSWLRSVADLLPIKVERTQDDAVLLSRINSP